MQAAKALASLHLWKNWADDNKNMKKLPGMQN